VDQAAKQAGLGNRETARRAKKVVDTGTPELVEALDAGLPPSVASKALELPEETQREAAREYLDGDRQAIKKALATPAVCRNCGNTTFDADGDCTRCREPNAAGPQPPAVASESSAHDSASEAAEAVSGQRGARKRAANGTAPARPRKLTATDRVDTWLSNIVSLLTTVRQEYGSVEKMFQRPDWDKNREKQFLTHLGVVADGVNDFHTEVQSYVANRST